MVKEGAEKMIDKALAKKAKAEAAVVKADAGVSETLSKIQILSDGLKAKAAELDAVIKKYTK